VIEVWQHQMGKLVDKNYLLLHKEINDTASSLVEMTSMCIIEQPPGRKVCSKTTKLLIHALRETYFCPGLRLYDYY